MAFLTTADFQCEWSNIDKCQQAWDEAISICKERIIKIIIVLGDLKQAMNPVDVRVIKFWKRAFKKAKKNGIIVIAVLGNHDRVGQYSESDNWFEIFDQKGVVCFDKPGVYDTGEERLFILPYCNTGDAKRGAEFLLRQRPDKTKDVLLFHHDIKGAKYNRQGSKSDESNLSVDDLNCTSYRYCISGHIHLPQRIKARKKVHGVLQRTFVYYTGSPFCHDWGECNQRKRYLVVGKGITSINSKIPRWFDESVSGFHGTKPRNWRGHKLRINVSCSASEDYGKRIERARKEAERKYKGAIIHVVPKFKDSEQLNVKIRTTDTDATKLKEYIRQSSESRRLGIRFESFYEYMLRRLAPFSSSLRGGNSFKFKKAKGKNFLSFKDVKIDFTQKGIIVVQGINHDTETKRSIGSGKTSLFQLLPVALQGNTFKEQKHDRWANRWQPKEKAYATVIGEVEGKKIVIKRGRRPPVLKLTVDGIPQSSGMKTTDKNGTQSLIEQTTGFTWQTLANAIYIDRSITHSFLSGTKKQRTELLSRFQNLERFSKALELVKKDAKSNEERIIEVRERLQHSRHSISESHKSLSDLRSLRDSNSKAAYHEYSKAKKKRKQWLKDHGTEYKTLLKKASRIESKYKHKSGKLDRLERKLHDAESEFDRKHDEGSKWAKFINSKQCPTCMQEVPDAWLLLHTKSISTSLKALDKTRNRIQEVVTQYRQAVQVLDGKHGQLQTKLSAMDKEKNVLTAFVQTTDRQWRELSSEQHSATSIVEKTKRKLKEYKNQLKDLVHSKRKLYKRKALYSYAAEAFSRDGIPAFLNRQLCPVLNRAADYYSDLFCGRDVQVKFLVEEGEFIPQVINAKGGEGIDDQSTGERALAGLIASFALREVAPKTNILILDEPGEGLDEQPSRQFARALKKLASRFCTIYIATHSPYILSELTSERVITIEKRKGISRITS
jgi:DNA repair exonuclease SbcCD nuclease subunit